MPCPYLNLLVSEGESPELIPGWKVLRCAQQGERLAFEVSQPHPGRFALYVGPRQPGAPAFATSERFATWYNCEDGFPPSHADVERFMRAAAERIRLHDDGTILPWSVPTVAATPAQHTPTPQAVDAPLWLLVPTGLLYLLGLAGLVLLAWTCRRNLSDWPVTALVGLAVILAASAMQRFAIIPFALVKVGMFHPVMDSAITLDWLPRYGAGGPLLYHVLFLLAPAHTQTVLKLHAVLSLLAIIPMVVLARDYLRLSIAGSLGLAVMLALTPVFLRDGNSESMLVPAMLFMTGGLVLLREGLARVSTSPWAMRFLFLATGLALLALGPCLRPELLVVAPVLAAVFLLPDVPAGERVRRLAPLAGVFALLVIPAAIFAALATTGEVDKGEILLSRLSPLRVLDGLATLNLVARPGVFPVAIPVLALGAVLLSLRDSSWPRRVALAAASLAWIALYSVDMNEDSMLRLHVPAAMLLAMLASDGANQAARAVAARFASAPSRRRSLLVATVLGTCILAWAATAVPGIPDLFRETNTTLQERIFLAAAEALPPEDVDIVVLGGEDEPRHALGQASLGQALVDQVAFARVHRHYPAWRLRPPWRNDRVLPISAFRTQGHLDRRTFFFLSAQCYATRDAGGEELWDVTKDPYRPMHPACRHVLTRHKLVPVYVTWMPHHPERSPAFQWWPDGFQGMTVGLFELTQPLQDPCPRDSLARAAEWYLDTAQEHLRADEEDEAEKTIATGEETLRDSLAMLEFAASLNYWMGNTHKDLARLDKAIEYWDRIAAVDIGYPFLLSKVGAVFSVRAQFFEKPQLKEYIEGRLAKRPDDTVALYLRGLSQFYHDEDYTGSLATLEDVRRIVPEDPRVHLYMALDHFYLGHQDEAERLIARGIDLSQGTDPDLYYVRSIIIRSKDMKLAVEDIQRYVDMSVGKEKVSKPEKEAWLRQELERLRKGEPSDWWRAKKPDEPWVKREK
jgi:tetratricopeptide (TPR) repeat protein